MTRNCPYTLDQDLHFLEHRCHYLNVLKTCLRHSLEETGLEMIVYPEMQTDYVHPSCETSFLLYCQDRNFFSDRVIAVSFRGTVDMHEALTQDANLFLT